jgi:hypothetical protein
VANSSQKKILLLLLTSLLTGTLDAMAALIISYKIPPATIFKFIASGWFGVSAFQGGTDMVVWGILFHYLIAAIFTVVCFQIYPVMIRIFKNKYLTGIIYGLVIWLIMNYAVLPYTNIHKSTAHINIEGLIKGIAALIICIGLPVALVADKHYKKRYIKIPT